MIGKQLAHYEILELVGRGGMGAVYRARDTRLGREVALKILPEEFSLDQGRLQRFANEARALAALQHPNVASIHGFEEADDHHFLVMELVEGQDLAQSLADGPLDIAGAVSIVEQICDGLAEAHEKGLVHRDIKPANIKIGENGRVRILDFGLAKTVELDSDANAATLVGSSGANLTQDGEAVGTVQYMSPEQALGRPVDARSDIFSLGVLMYEMLTGTMAFGGTTAAAIFDAILHGHPTPADRLNPELPRDLVCVIESAIQKDPQRRPKSVGDLKKQLLAVDLQSSGTSRTPSIAVLPFVNMSADPENEYFTDGLAEEILSSLSRVENLRVASRTSSFAFKGKQVDIREIAQLLEVDTVLEGSVRKSGQRLRISVQLVKAEDGYQLWSERFDREMKDVFEVQDEIAQSITSALRVVLSPEEKQNLRNAPTRNIDAYDAYLQGKGHYQRFGEENMEASFNLFQKATQLDPGFVLAWLGLAECVLWMHQWYTAEDLQLEAAETAAKRLMELVPDRAEAHLALGMVEMMHDHLEQAEAAYREAIRLDDKLFQAHYFLARLMVHTGRMRVAAEHFGLAAEADPEDYQAVCLQSNILDSLEDDVAADNAARVAFTRVERALGLHPGDTRALSLGAGLLLRAGDSKQSMEWTRRSLELAPTDSGVLYNAACNYATLGRIDEALDILERNIGAGWGNREWLEADSDMDPLRDHPRFQRLLDRML